jgi:enamine deaminase RidA (YjgF/YER057c/UK114 family)
MDAFNAIQGAEVMPRLRDAGCRPSGVLIGVTRLALADMLIEFEATAVA